MSRIGTTSASVSRETEAEVVPMRVVILGHQHLRDNAAAAMPLDDDDLEPEAHEVRRAYVGTRTVELYGRALAAGDRVDVDFTIPPARASFVPLTGERLGRGLVLMTTLPNIHKHACAAQIVQTEALARRVLPEAEVLHVASDRPEYWQEVDHLHGDVRAAGYSLKTSADGDVFRAAFGVGVRGSDRIARGLFALYRGVVLAADVPEDQARTPDVARFVERTRSLLALANRTENE